MPLEDDLAQPLTDEEMHRRRFLGLIGAGALGLAAAGTGVTTLRFLEPRVLFEEDTRFGVARPEDVAVGTVLVLPKRRIYLIRTGDGFYALSSICTHLGCMTRYDPQAAALACPCHGSRFTLDGRVSAGPAPRPLARLQLTLERGVLVVDAAKRVAHDAILKVG